MELLMSYSSDESSNDDDSEKPENKTSNEVSSISANYFNLETNVLEEHCPPAKNETYLDSCSLKIQSKILNAECYGPSKINLPSRNVAQPDYQKKLIYNFDSIKRKWGEELVDYNAKIINSFSKEKVDGPKKSCLNSDGNKIKCTDIFKIESKAMFESNNEFSGSVPRYESKSFVAHESSVTSLHWCIPEYSHLLLTSSIDCSVKLWDMNYCKCVQVIQNSFGVKAAKWSLNGSTVLFGGFDKKAVVYDIMSGENSVTFNVTDYVSSLSVHPHQENINVIGSNNAVFVFDKRQPQGPIQSFLSKCKYVLDMVFINEGRELVCSTEIVARDSSDKTIMVWDFETASILSNQIYSERYTCPSLSVQPQGQYFAAQSNGDYLVTFSGKRPYKMQNKRYSGHQVSGYGIGCDFNLDGELLASGDSNGSVFVYSTRTSKVCKKYYVKADTPIVRVKWHPVLSSMMACGTLDGYVHLWK